MQAAGPQNFRPLNQALLYLGAQGAGYCFHFGQFRHNGIQPFLPLAASGRTVRLGYIGILCARAGPLASLPANKKS